MQKIKHTKWLPVLMTITILAITGFQLYWLKKTYEREKRTLEMRTNFMFRETVHSLQASKLKLDKIITDTSSPARILLQERTTGKPLKVKVESSQKMISIINALKEKAKDSAVEEKIILRRLDNQQVDQPKPLNRRQSRLMQFLFDIDSLQDSLSITEIEQAYARRLQQQNLDLPFNVQKFNRDREGERAFNEVTLGFSNPITYQLQLGNIFPFLLKRISAAILFSIFLIGFTVLSFTLLYRNLLKQRRLAEIKNEFISNITHELKTPIATVSVAIEALKTFNANLDAEKTKEYLNISSNELQRLSLLVDKVLKLSMFEKKEIDLKYETFDMQSLVDEVTSSMRLQFEKHNAIVTVNTEGNTTLEGDRLHLVSVIFNMLDNALKYSNASPEINILMKGHDRKVELCIKDKGIGIPEEYHEKVFEKFFRVPTGNIHNAKGYGLGLSYVSHVVKKHKGSIRVESSENEGSNFIITLPKYQA